MDFINAIRLTRQIYLAEKITEKDKKELDRFLDSEVEELFYNDFDEFRKNVIEEVEYQIKHTKFALYLSLEEVRATYLAKNPGKEDIFEEALSYAIFDDFIADEFKSNMKQEVEKELEKIEEGFDKSLSLKEKQNYLHNKSSKLDSIYDDIIDEFLEDSLSNLKDELKMDYHCNNYIKSENYYYHTHKKYNFLLRVSALKLNLEATMGLIIIDNEENESFIRFLFEAIKEFRRSLNEP